MSILIIDLTKTTTDVTTVERLDILLQNVEKEKKMNKIETKVQKEDTLIIQEMIEEIIRTIIEIKVIKEMIEEETIVEMIEVKKEETAIQDLEVETTQDLTKIEADQEIGLEVEKETTEEPHHHIPDK